MNRRFKHVLVVVVLGASLLLTTSLPVSTATAETIATPGKDRPARTVVKTSDGVLRGNVTDTGRSFEGVRYAAPVVRWKRPEPAQSWAGVRDATSPGPDCAQTAVFWRPTSAASTSEDCLFLNVYTSRSEVASRPVMVFFHGGGSINGAATDVRPARMASEGNSIVISANYRLGVLGGINLPALDAETPDGLSGGNHANLDKIEVLRWVQRNIGSFGGDPNNVTIAGQSAGAGSVCWLLASPTAAGLFDKAVVQSAGACGGAPTRAASHAAGERFAEAAGCADPATMLTCLRSTSVSKLLEVQLATGTRAGTVAGGSDLPLSPADAFAAGKFNRVPVIFGNTRNEAQAFVYEGNDLVRQPVTAETYESQIRAAYRARADAVLTEYPVDEYVTPGVARAKVQTDERVCGSVPLSRSLSKWTPTYTYEFRDETAPLRPYMTVPSSFPIGSGHTSEVPYLWGSETSTPLNSRQLKLSDLMISAWTKFAETGTPNGRQLPDWPQYETQDGELRIGFLPAGRAEVLKGARYDSEHHCGFWLG